MLSLTVFTITIFISTETYLLLWIAQYYSRYYKVHLRRKTVKNIKGIKVVFHKNCFLSDIDNTVKALDMLDESVVRLYARTGRSINVFPAKVYRKKYRSFKNSVGLFFVNRPYISVLSNGDVEDTLIHEFGHFLDFYVAQFRFYYYRPNARPKMFESNILNIDLILACMKEDVNEYYKSSTSEFAAYAFTRYTYGNMDGIPRHVRSFIEYLIENAHYADGKNF